MGLTLYQAHMQRELKGKMKGKTAAQRKAIFKAAAASYKGKPSTRSRLSKAVNRVRTSRVSHKSKSTGGNHNTSKGGFNTNKLFKIVRIGALAFPAAVEIMKPTPPVTKLYEIGRKYFAFNTATGKLDTSQLAQGYGPWAVASVVTYGIPKLISFLRGVL